MCYIPDSYHDMSFNTRTPTLWSLRKVLTRINLSMPNRLIWTNTFHLLWIFCFRNQYSIPLSPLIRNESARISLRGLRRLILVDTLRSPYNWFSRGTANIILSYLLLCQTEYAKNWYNYLNHKIDKSSSSSKILEICIFGKNIFFSHYTNGIGSQFIHILFTLKCIKTVFVFSNFVFVFVFFSIRNNN